MIAFLYNCVLLAGTIAALPWLLVRVASTEKYRDGLWERLRGAPRRLLPVQAGDGTIWIHAVSVGEVLAVSRLANTLQVRLRRWRVVVSTTTRTGQKLARERFGAHRCFYFPLDLPWAVVRTLRVLRPQMLVLAESELWPNLLQGCERAGIPVLIVNGRVSDRSLPRYLRLRAAWRPFLRAITGVLAQSEEDARRFVRIGIPAGRVRPGGNLKYDVRAADGEVAVLEPLRAALPTGTRVLVCGSTVRDEEPLLLEAWKTVTKSEPRAVMVLAPRHPERFPEVQALLEREGVAHVRRSRWIAAPAPLAPGSVFLLDSIGELAAVYALATVAFVGGSLVQAGGHNPLEPAQFGVPVCMGPHYANFRGVVELLRAEHAIAIVTAAEMGTALTDLLRNPGPALAMGERARAIFEREAGATERAVSAIEDLVSTRVEEA